MNDIMNKNSKQRRLIYERFKFVYKGKEYFEDKKHVLLVKVEVIFLEYAFTQCGLEIKYFDENHRNDYLINYREENSIPVSYTHLTLPTIA